MSFDEAKMPTCLPAQNIFPDKSISGFTTNNAYRPRPKSVLLRHFEARACGEGFEGWLRQ